MLPSRRVGLRHLVAVFGFETARREGDLLHHVAVDDAEAFLLTGAHQQRTIDLHVVDVYGVLIETASTDIILARQLVVAAHAGLLLHQLFHGIARCRGCLFQVGDIQLLCTSSLTPAFGHHHLVEGLHGMHGDEQTLVALGLAQHSGACLIAYHGEFHHYRVLGGQLQLILAFQVGHCHGSLFQTADGGQFYGFAVFIADFT